MKGKGFWIVFVSILTIAVGVFAFIAIKNSANKVQVFADTEAKYQTRFLKPEESDTPENSTAEDAVAFALYTLTHTESFDIITDGESKASVATQLVKGRKTIIGDEAITYSMSSGLVKMGLQKYFVKNSGKVFYRDYDTIKGGSVTWTNNPPKCVSEKTYRKTYGQDPFTGNNYIICPETINTGEMINKGNGLWGIKLNMKTESDYAPFWYQREVAANASSSMIPEFQLIELEFVVDSSWRIQYLNIHEKYLVKSMGVKAVSDTVVTDTYHYDNVEFDKDDYAYFKQYKNMVPSDAEEEKVTDDVLTMLTSSLIKDDGTNTNIKVDLNIGGEELKGLVELNLTDLKNIKAKGELNEIYFEYIDNTIYISLGNNLKIKSETENLTKLISMFDTGDGALSLDVDSIIKAINSGEVTQEENIYKVNTSLTVGNIKINISFSTEFNEENHTYKLISLNANLVLNDMPISVEAFNTTDSLNVRDLSTYSDLSNLDYVFEYLSKLILYKAASIDLNVDYKGILANVKVDASLADSLVLNAKAKVMYEGKEVEASIKFKNDIIYIDFYNIHLKASLMNIIDLVKKYVGVDLSALLVFDPSIEKSSIDIKTIIITVLSLDFDKIIKDFALNEEELNATVDLSSILETLKEINLVLKNKDGISVEINYDEIKANALIKPLESYELNIETSEYSNIKEIQYLVDDIISLVDKKALSLKASALYSDLKINVNLLADFNEAIKLDAEIILTYENKQVKLYVKYIDDSIYLSVGNINIMASKDYLFALLSKFGVDLSLDLDTNISVEKILGIILSLDYEKLIKTLKFESEKISINLDLSDYIDILSDLEIIINNTKDKGFSVETNFYHVSASLTALDSVRIGLDKEYQDLSQADFLIDDVLDLIEKKRMALDLSLSVKGLNINVTGEVSFDSDIIANVKAIVESNGLSKTINVFFQDNTLYLDIEGIKLSISISDLMTLLSKAGVEFDLNSSNISIESIIGIIFSIDLDKLIKEFTIADKEIKLSLNVSDFISELNELDIMIKDETDGLSLSLSLFDVLLKVKPIDEVSKKTLNDFNNISFASFILDDALLIVKNKKAEATVSIKVLNLDVNAHLYVDFNESLKLKALIDLSNGTNSKSLEVLFIDNAVYLTIDNISVKITLDELISLLNEFGIDTESVMSKLNSNDLSLEDIIAVIFSLDFKKIVKSLNINENNINLSLDLSDFIESLNDLVILVENTEGGFDLLVNFYEINAQVLSDTNFNIEVEENKYQNLTFVKFLVDDVMLILDSKEVEANVSLVYESLNIQAKALIDFRDSIKVKADITLSNGINSKEVEVLFIDNTIYLSVDSINVKITLETLFGLLSQAGIDTSSITNISLGEMSVEEIINTVLSIDLAKIIKVFKLEESKITLSADLSSFVDFLSEINVILTDEGNNVLGLSLDMFNINGTVRSVSNSDINVEKEYKELSNLSFIIDDVFEIIDTKAVEVNLSLKYEDFNINGNIIIDFNDSIKVKGHAVLNYKEYTKELDLVFINNTIYLSIDSINLSITLEDLFEILSYADIDATAITGVISGEASMNVNEIIDTVLSINFSDIVKALEIEDKYLSVNLDLSRFIESLNDLSVIITEGTDGLDLTVNMFDITGNIKSIESPVIEAFDTVNLGEAKDIVKNVIEIVNTKALALDASLKYESLIIALNGQLDFKDSIKVKVNAIISNNEFSKELSLVFINNTIYVSLDNLNLMITIDELMEILGLFDISFDSNELTLDSILGIILSKNLNEIITTLEFADSKLNLSVNLKDLIDILDEINMVISASKGINVSLDMFDVSIKVNALTETSIETNGEYERVYNAKFALEFVKAVLDKKALNINLSLKYETLNVSGNVVLDFNDLIKAKANITLTNGIDSKDIEILFIDNVIYLSVDSINVKISLETLFSILTKAGVDTTSFEGIVSGSMPEVDVNEIIGLILSVDLNEIIKVLRLEESKITLSLDLSRFLDALNDISVIISDLDNKIGLNINMFDIEAQAEVIDNSNITVEKEYKELANLSFIIDDVFEIIDTKAVEVNLSLKYESLNINALLLVDFNDSIALKANARLSYKDEYKDVVIVFKENTIYLSLDSINLSITLEDLFEILAYAEVDTTKIQDLMNGEKTDIDVLGIIDTILSINFSDIVKALEIEDKYLSVNLDLSRFIESLNDLSVIITEGTDGLDLTVNMFDITGSVKSIESPAIDTFDTNNLGEAKEIIRNVIELVKNKKISVNGTLKYESLNISFEGKVDFTDELIASVKAILSNSENSKEINVVFVNKTLYLSIDSINLMISVEELTDILTIFDIDLTKETTLDDILDKVFDIDFNELIKTLEIVDSKINLGVDLTSLIDILGEINAIISVNNGINVSLDKLDANINVSNTEIVEYTLKDSYERVYNAKFIVELVKDILDKKALSVNLSLSKDDLSISGDAVLDFTDSFKVKANLIVNFKELELPVSILFLVKEGDTENVIYLDLYNIHATITVEELLEALKLENKELKIDDIIDLVLSLNFDELINNMSIEEGLISLLLDLRSLDIELLDKIIDKDVIQDLSIESESNNLRVYSNSLFNLNVLVSTIENSNIEKADNEYINLSSILSEVMDKVDELKNSSFEVVINGNVNLGDVLIVNLDATLDLNVKVVKDGDNYQISVIGHIETSDFIIDLKAVIDDGYLYLTLGGLNAKLKLDGIMDFIEEVVAIFKEEGSETTSLDLSSLNSLVETLSLSSSHEINANLSSLISKFTTTYVLINLNGESIVKVNDDNNNEFASLSVSLNANDSLEKTELPSEYVTEDDILSLLEDINDIIKLVKSKNFLIKIASSTSPIEFYKDSELKFRIYGTLNVVPRDEEHYNYKIEVNLLEFKDNKKVNDHYIGLVYYEEMFYLTYRNSTNEANAINATSTKEDVYGLIAAVEEALGIDLSMLDDLLVDFTPYLDENLKHIDFTQLRGLLKSITKSDDKPSTKEKINISKVLYEFKILSGWCSTRLDNHEISRELPAKNYSTISFRRDDSREYNDAYIDSIYLKYEEGVYTAVKNIVLEFENGIEVKKPNFNKPYDFSHLGELVKGLLVAATYHDFKITGTIKLNAIAVVNMDVPVEILVHNDEEGKPVVFIHIDMNDVPLLARVLVSQKDIYMIYKDGYMYIERKEGSKSTKIKVTTETFFEDLVYYLLDFSMGLPSSITSMINSQSDEFVYVDASKALTNYSYSAVSGNPRYTIGLDLGEIVGNDDLGILKLSINLAKIIAERVDDKVYEVNTVKSITDLSLDIASVLNITCSSLSLSNVSYNNGFEVISVSGMSLVDYISSYISNKFTISGNEYAPDMIYQNNTYKGKISHHVYFMQGNGTTLSGDPLQIITIDVEAGSRFNLQNPTSEYIMIGSRRYYFGGWYTSRDYKTEFTSDMCTMGERNINIYALWIPMYEYRVEDVNGTGYSTFYKLGESTQAYTVNTSHGEFLGFYDRVTGELVDSSTTLSSRVVEGDIYVYAKWDKMYYLVLDDETKLILSSESNNTDQINGLENDKYQIYSDGIYYTYLKQDITSFMLHTNYESLFEKHVEQDFTYYTFNIYTYNSVRDGYREYTFNFNTELYKDNNGLTPYVSVMILKTNSFSTSLMPYAKYSIYEINAWANTSNEYYTKDVVTTVEGTRFNAYYSVLPSYFSRNGSKITGFASGKSAETLILPYFINGTKMTTVGQAAFSGNSSIKHIYIADSYTTLEQDAFKDTENLEDVYVSASVTSIAKDAFYYSYVDRSSIQPAHGRVVKLYFLYDDLRSAYNFNSNKLLAYKYTDITHWSKTDRYYGESNTQTPETIKSYIIDKVMELFN